LEDPVLRLDLYQALKDIGYYGDTSFNRELVKVRDYALLALLLKFNGNEKGIYKEIAERAGEHEKELKKYTDANTTLLERCKKAFEYIKDNPLELIGLALGIAGLKK
jgi:hypothetical protein